MKHDFDVMVITIHGACTRCKKNISNSKSISRNDLKMYNVQPFTAFQAEKIYQEINDHECVSLMGTVTEDTRILEG